MTLFSSRFKKKKEHSVFWLLFLIFLVLGMGIFALALNVKIAKEKTAAEKELKFLEAKLQQLKIQKEEYLKKIPEVEGQEYLEKVSREDFNLQKEGEKVIIFPIIKESQKPKKQFKDDKDKNFFEKIVKKIGQTLDKIF